MGSVRCAPSNECEDGSIVIKAEMPGIEPAMTDVSIADHYHSEQS